jgi:hypothetical protein
MAAKPPGVWDLASLRDEARELLDRGSTTLQRARAQRLLERIKEFDGLQARCALLRRPATFAAEDASRASAGDPGSGAASPPADPRFDGSGWLLPVHSTRRAAPPYALLDSEGRILQFVSPAPGLNLHRYLRKEIGVYGQRSYIPSLDKPHVTAHRVVGLSRHRR